ncbi:siderophore ABC transporter substrate-binding protein [Metabacillus indicus]|uniref:siderophore ABC transporter substrate-binding protein n=1 Tax=Metabacillus indicus TaxID=246786 RepID=UPI003CF2254E
MKKIFILAMGLMLAVFAAACGTKEAEETSASAAKKELTIEHQLGETKVPENPEKVVVFDFGTLDSMDKLGIEAAGVPQQNIPSYLSKYEDEKYENVGGLKEPDFEKINEMAPDLIIISGRQQDSYEEMSKIAPTIFMGVDTEKYMESFKENVTTLGKIFGKEAEAEKEFAKVEDSIKSLNEKASSGSEKALIILANDGKVSAYGAGSRFGIIHDEFGFAQADENIEASTHGQSISFEYIVEKDPDYLFVIDRGAVVGGESSAKQVVENELVKKTKAYQNGNIIYLDPNYWYLSGGGLVSVAGMAEEAGKVIE